MQRPADPARLLLGSGTIGDTAEDEKSHPTAGVSPQVRVAQRLDGWAQHMTLTNANGFPVAVEVTLGGPGRPAIDRPSVSVTRIDGVETWRTTVPAHGRVTLDYSVP